MSRACAPFGERNLLAYISIHDAAIAFCERHITRLSHHVPGTSIDAVPSCMHLARSVSRVLSRQVEQLIAGLEGAGALDAADWYAHRERLDRYLSTYLDLLRIVHSQWVAALLNAYPEQSVRDAVLPDLEPLTEYIESFLDVRDRVECCRGDRLKVRTMFGNLVVPPVHPTNLIDPEGWHRWTTQVTVQARGIRALAG